MTLFIALKYNLVTSHGTFMKILQVGKKITKDNISTQLNQPLTMTKDSIIYFLIRYK